MGTNLTCGMCHSKDSIKIVDGQVLQTVSYNEKGVILDVRGLSKIIEILYC